MKLLHSAVLSVIFSASCIVSTAQNSVLAGKITDESNKPVAGARIIVSKDAEGIALVSDDEGIYRSPLLFPASYNIDITVAGRHYKAKKLYLAPEKKFYNFHLTASRAELVTSAEEPDQRGKIPPATRYQR